MGCFAQPWLPAPESSPRCCTSMKANTEGSRDKSGKTTWRKRGERGLLTNMPLTWNLFILRPLKLWRQMVSIVKKVTLKITAAHILLFPHLRVWDCPVNVPCCCCALQPCTALLAQSHFLLLALPPLCPHELCQPPWPPSPSHTPHPPAAQLLLLALPATFTCSTFCHLGAGPLQRRA